MSCSALEFLSSRLRTHRKMKKKIFVSQWLKRIGCDFGIVVLTYRHLSDE